MGFMGQTTTSYKNMLVEEFTLSLKKKVLFIIIPVLIYFVSLNNKSAFSTQVFNRAGDGNSKVYITGDIHGLLGIERILKINHLDEDDYLIILGDFGLLWDGSLKETKALDKLNKKPFTTLIIDGNHENFDMLNALPMEQWNGGKVHKIKDKVLHLMRGEVFTINHKKYFTFGGGKSIDKDRRVDKISWWKEEMPSTEEMSNGLKNLEKCDYVVDYILTHTTDVDNLYTIGDALGFTPTEDELNTFLSEVKSKTSYNKWCFGHFHLDWKINNKDRVVLEEILEIGN